MPDLRPMSPLIIPKNISTSCKPCYCLAPWSHDTIRIRTLPLIILTITLFHHRCCAFLLLHWQDQQGILSNIVINILALSSNHIRISTWFSLTVLLQQFREKDLTVVRSSNNSPLPSEYQKLHDCRSRDAKIKKIFLRTCSKRISFLSVHSLFLYQKYWRTCVALWLPLDCFRLTALLRSVENSPATHHRSSVGQSLSDLLNFLICTDIDLWDPSIVLLQCRPKRDLIVMRSSQHSPLISGYLKLIDC